MYKNCYNLFVICIVVVLHGKTFTKRFLNLLTSLEPMVNLETSILLVNRYHREVL